MPETRTLRLAEIAELLGVTHQRTSAIVRRSGFPAPIGYEGRSGRWNRREFTA